MLILNRIFINNASSKLFRNSARNFFELYRKGDGKYHKEDERPKLEKIRDGLGLLKGEIKLWTEEVKEKFACDPKWYVPGDTEIVWTFNSQENLNKWIVTSDKDNNDGGSNCDFQLSKLKKGFFSGYLETALPKDGIICKTGYCNIKAINAKRSFYRESYLDWTMFTHLVLRVRGDGRAYMVNLHVSGEYDIQWNDMYNYVLYTRGGPYWQTAKLPFSRFLLSSKGRVQDKQCPIELSRIGSLGITCAGNVGGPFQLEIDYIGLHYDGKHEEQFAYEMYQTPDKIVF